MFPACFKIINMFLWLTRLKSFHCSYIFHLTLVLLKMPITWASGLGYASYICFPFCKLSRFLYVSCIILAFLLPQWPRKIVKWDAYNRLIIHDFVSNLHLPLNDLLRPLDCLANNLLRQGMTSFFGSRVTSAKRVERSGLFGSKLKTESKYACKTRSKKKLFFLF